VKRSELRMGNRPDGRLDGKMLSRRDPTRQCTVNLGHFVLPQGCGETRASCWCARKEYDSGSAPSQAVSGGGSGAVIPHQRKKRVFEESPARHRGKPGWLCNCEQIVVFMENGVDEGNFRLVPGRTPPDEPLAGSWNGVGESGQAIQQDLAVFQATPPFRFGRVVISPHEIGEQRASGGVGAHLLPILESVVHGHLDHPAFRTPREAPTVFAGSPAKDPSGSGG